MTFTKELLSNLIESNPADSDCQANAESREVHELARMALAGMEADQKGNAAVATLESHGFTWSGGKFWKPPLGLPPAYVSNERAELENYRNAQQVVLGEKVIGTFNAEKNELALLDKNMTVEKFAHWHVHNSLEVIIRPSRAAMQPVADMAAQLESARLHIAELEAAPPAPVGDGEAPVPLMPDFPGRTLTQRECYRAGFEAGKALRDGCEHEWVHHVPCLKPEYYQCSKCNVRRGYPAAPQQEVK